MFSITGSLFRGRDQVLFRLDVVVVFLAIDLTAGAVLLAVDLAFFLTSQFASVGLAIGMDLLIDALLPIFSAGGFTGVIWPLRIPCAMRSC